MSASIILFPMDLQIEGVILPRPMLGHFHSFKSTRGGEDSTS